MAPGLVRRFELGDERWRDMPALMGQYDVVVGDGTSGSAVAARDDNRGGAMDELMVAREEGGMGGGN